MDVTQHQVYCFDCGDYVYDADVDRIVNRERNESRINFMQLFGTCVCACVCVCFVGRRLCCSHGKT